MKPPRELPERSATLREQLREELRGGFITARELSARLHISEKEVGDHLERSLRHAGEHIEIDPARCMSCGFRARPKFARIGKCPECRSTHIDPPMFRLQADAAPPE